MKILKRELKVNPVTTEPLLEILVTIPGHTIYDEQLLASDPIVAHMFRQMLTQQIETEISQSTLSPMLYPDLEDLSEVHDETVDYTNDQSEWEKLCEQHKTHYEESFSAIGQENPNTVCYVDGLSVRSYMLKTIATRDGKPLVAKTKFVKKAQFNDALSSLDAVYEIVSYGQLNLDTNDYEKIYRIRGVFK